MVELERTVFIVLRGGAVVAASLLVVGLFTSTAVLLAGAVILMLTPMTRVLIAGLSLLARREYAYFVMAAYVLTILVITVLVSL